MSRKCGLSVPNGGSFHGESLDGESEICRNLRVTRRGYRESSMICEIAEAEFQNIGSFIDAGFDLAASRYSELLCAHLARDRPVPRYMGRNLAKLEFGKPGHDLARTFLTRNVRAEQRHAHYWVDWAEASGITRADLLGASEATASAALSHWCWYVCDREPLAVAMAATNYAIEGVTGEWTHLACSSDRYADSLFEEKRKSGMRWLRAHARYDDAHPWEALEIVATILGANPDPMDIRAVRAAIERSYDYMLCTFEDCMADTNDNAVFAFAPRERTA